MLTFFGLIHGEAIGLDRAPTLAFSYLAVSGLLLLSSRYAVGAVLGAAPQTPAAAE